MRVFPVDPAARPRFSDDWGAPRAGHVHEGTDIFAPEGTAVRAVADGTVTAASGQLGGQVAYLTERDGTRYYFAHLSGYAGDFPRYARAGEVIGYVGRTGNAAGTAPHLHFEWRPLGGNKANPFGELRALLAAGAGQAGGSGFGAPSESSPAAPLAGGAGLLLLVALYLLGT